MMKNRAQRSYQSKVNNAQGHHLEECIERACKYYRFHGIAEVVKVPEPFRVEKKYEGGKFTARFTGLAQPDFQGTLKGGRSIVFEAKYTSTDRIKQSVVTDKQVEALEAHYTMGAVVGVCCAIQGLFCFIPWEVWRNMKAIYGRKYILATEAEVYRIKFDGQALFLDYIHDTATIKLLGKVLI